MRVLCSLGVTLIILMAGIAAAQPTTIGISDYKTFTIQYTDPRGQAVRLTNRDAFIPPYSFQLGNYLLTFWHIRVPGSVPQKEVWVATLADFAKHEYMMGFLHPTSAPPGWRVDHVEQTFSVAFGRPLNINKVRVLVPKVYGPTIYSAATAHGMLELYPTFLQTQMLAVEDTKNGGCLALAAFDDGGIRKWMGFETDGSATGFKYKVRYVPDQGVLDPLSAVWLPSYAFRFGFLLDDYSAAVDWYRGAQLARPSSFLSRRTPAAKVIHPRIRDAKFSVGVGAVLSPIQYPNGQFDLSADYRRDVLRYFAGVHGPDMMLYHMSWFVAPPGGAAVIPDVFDTVIPGHAALIAEAAALNKNIGSVAYTLPGLIERASAAYDSTALVIDKDGGVSSNDLPNWPDGVYHRMCYFHQTTTDLYTTVYVERVHDATGFIGAYLDALSAAPTCYAHHRHGHVYGTNEQVIGIDRLLAGIHAGVQIRHGFDPALFSETPTDCVVVDGSALDLDNWDPDYWNLFAMTYSGEEWPTFSSVLGWDPVTQVPSGLEYTRELANCLAGGARPLIVWPEQTGIMPTDPASSTEFDDFRALLNQYIVDYDAFWKGIIFGRHFAPLDPSNLLTDTISGLPAAASPSDDTDPITWKWPLPGYRPGTDGFGASRPSRLRGRATLAVMHGLCEPAGKPGQRLLVLCRWTDPAQAQRLGLPTSHPLHKKTLTVTMMLSARNLKARPGALIEVYDPATRRSTVVGRLSVLPDVKIPIVVQLTRLGGLGVVAR